jgi:hypothetical protein
VDQDSPLLEEAQQLEGNVNGANLCDIFHALILKLYFGNVGLLSPFTVNHFTFFTYFTLLSITLHLSNKAIHMQNDRM